MSNQQSEKSIGSEKIKEEKPKEIKEDVKNQFNNSQKTAVINPPLKGSF